MEIRETRQERIHELLDPFVDNTNLTSTLTLILYPKELRRVKKEFPSLTFNIANSFSHSSGKKLEVKVTR